MTDIYELQAGRELNTRVARILFPGGWWDDANWVQGFMGRPDTHYSTNISDAWKLMQQLIQDGYVVRLEAYPGQTEDSTGWECTIIGTSGTLDPVMEGTAPMAICRAALIAYGR